MQSLPLVFDIKDKSRTISHLAVYFVSTLVQRAC